MSLTRKATHADSWYTGNSRELDRELSSWLAQVDVDFHPARAIISPHAGYSYSGPAAAYGFKQIRGDTGVKRIFILGPSHHVYLSGCALTKTARYQTPIGDLVIDEEMNLRLEESGLFERMSQRTDEDEHSIEMQLPYVAKVMAGRQFTIVPILVGSTNAQQEETYGKLLAPYLMDPSNVVVISSDFCHWGKRFRYTYYDTEQGEIHKSIEHLDRMGMSLIEDLNPRGFLQYLDKYKNTICGRHPINILLNAIKVIRETNNGLRVELKFLKYAQSSKCYDMKDSSVSYATAAVLIG